jgi:outer membrane biosynthesis protein TonB
MASRLLSTFESAGLSATATFASVLWIGLALPGLPLLPGVGGGQGSNVAISLNNAVLGVQDSRTFSSGSRLTGRQARLLSLLLPAADPLAKELATKPPGAAATSGGPLVIGLPPVHTGSEGAPRVVESSQVGSTASTPAPSPPAPPSPPVPRPPAPSPPAPPPKPDPEPQTPVPPANPSAPPPIDPEAPSAGPQPPVAGDTPPGDSGSPDTAPTPNTGSGTGTGNGNGNGNPGGTNPNAGGSNPNAGGANAGGNGNGNAGGNNPNAGGNNPNAGGANAGGNGNGNGAGTGGGPKGPQKGHQ